MTRVVRWMLAWVLCAGLMQPVQVHAQPESSEASSSLPAAAEPSPLLKEPQSPAEMFDAVVLLVDLARFDLAKIYLQQFVDSQPSDEMLQSLRDRYSTGEFLRLSRIPELKSAAQPLLDRLNAASRKQAEDPAYVDGLINRLSGNTAARELAIRELRNAGVRAVPQILQKLATTQDGNEQDVIVLALSRMGQPVVPALIAALDSSNTAVRMGCIEALTMLKSEAAVSRLWVLGFDEDFDVGTQDTARRAISKIRYGSEDRAGQLSAVAAIEELRQTAQNLLTGVTGTELYEVQPTTTVWVWNDADQSLTTQELTPESAALREANRLARSAFLLDSDRPAIQTLYLTALLAGEVQRRGWDEPLSASNSAAIQTAVSTGVGPLQAVLRNSMEIGRTDAAWAALQGLSALAAPDVLARESGRVSPVIAALNYPDQRVQFAAAAVILRSDSRLDFSGASRVTEVLRRALTDPGQSRAVVINPDQVEGAQLGNFLAQEGYDPVLAPTGREGFLRAAELTGINLVVVHANVANWGLTQTLSNLRADARTAYLPIVVYGPEAVRGKTARLVMRTANCMFAGESPGAESFWQQVRPLLSRRATPAISAQQRNDFKSISAYWLATLAGDSQSGIANVASAENELLPLVAEDPIAANVLTTLGRIGTNQVQSRLAIFALNDHLPISTRQLAARELAAHIPRFGLLISADEVATLTAGWEQATDPELQGTLAAIVGGLKPNAGLVGARLRRLATQPAQQREMP